MINNGVLIDPDLTLIDIITVNLYIWPLINPLLNRGVNGHLSEVGRYITGRYITGRYITTIPARHTADRLLLAASAYWCSDQRRWTARLRREVFRPIGRSQCRGGLLCYRRGVMRHDTELHMPSMKNCSYK